MAEEMGQEGLGQFVAKPNSSLQLIDEKRRVDKIEVEQNNELRLQDIKKQAKQEVVDEMNGRAQMEASMREIYEKGRMDGGLGSFDQNAEPLGTVDGENISEDGLGNFA